MTLPTAYTFSSGQIKRTDYKISYPFKSGYIYSIEITAFGSVSNSSSYPSLGTSLFTTAGLPNTSTSCGSSYISGFPLFASLFTITTNSTSTVYSPSGANFVSPSNYDYLVLEATCQAAQNITANVYIQKIKITETLPVSFTLSPSSPTISCGSTTPQTFTVTNVHNTPNVTNYLWNLGSNNGWIYNGSPAPSTISTGTINTLMLTPSCSDTKQNISVTVTAGGNNYQTNISAITNSSPSLYISGSNTFCSGTNSYSISNLPCNAAVSWSSSNSNIATVTSTGNPATVTKIGNGIFTLTATASGSCLSSPIVVSKQIIVGAPTNLSLKLNYYNPGGTALCRGSAYSFQALMQDGSSLASKGITNVQWRVVALPGPSAQIQYNAGAYHTSQSINGEAVTITFPSSPSTPLSNAAIQLNLQNTCGWTAGDEGDGQWSNPQYGSIQVSNQNCGWFLFLVSPNPADGKITITQNKKEQKTMSRLMP